MLTDKDYHEVYEDHNQEVEEETESIEVNISRPELGRIMKPRGSHINSFKK